jgi:glycosyltransferase involved in cell wall biosynthesis
MTPTPRSGRSVLGRLRASVGRLRALLRTPDQLADLAEEQMETRQQLVHDGRKLHEQSVAGQQALEREVSELRAELERLASAHRGQVVRLGRSIAALGEAVAGLEPPEVSDADGPLVSVVLPVRDRRAVVADAVRSVLTQSYANWELIVVDDGSRDDSAAVVTAVAAGDERVQLLKGDGRGAPAARNRALEVARGEIVAYLDSDNRWLPSYLAHVVAAFRDRPDAGSALAMQLMVDERTREWSIRDDDHRSADLEHLNFVDLNAYSHRRSLIEQLGNFDESLRRLSDWDLVRRHAGQVVMVRIAVPGSVYRLGSPDQISSTEPAGYYEHLVRSKHRPLLADGLRVLCAEWHYPQLSETYVQSDIEGLKRLGAQVEVWSEESGTGAPFDSEEAVHHGDLAGAIEAARPDVVLAHWLHLAAKAYPSVSEAGVPMVVRGHGFDFASDLVEQLLAQPNVRRLYLFPHFIERVRQADSRLRPLPVGFDTQRYRPAGAKDRRLVVRAGVGIPTKDYATFLDASRRCPDHRFVLCLVTAHQLEGYVAEVVDLRNRMGAPVEIRVDVPHAEVAELVTKAGIYLHTHGEQAPFGMPISIAEAMATGAYTLVPDLPGGAAYVGDAADLYRSSEDAADRILAAAEWDDATWDGMARRAVDRAFARYGHVDVAESMVRDWQQAGIVTGSSESSGQLRP